MREHETGRPRTPGRWHPWIKRISNVTAQITAASLLASGIANSLAARKDKSRHDNRGARDQSDRDRDGGNNRNREDRQANDAKEERGSQRENRDRSDGAGDDDKGHRGGKHEHQDGALNEASSGASNKQKLSQTKDNSGTGDGSEDTSGGDQDSTEGGNGDTTGGGGGGRDDGGGGGRGDGGGNEAGNAGSGFFDRPLATKARRRSNDFDNADRDEDDRRIIVDVDPEGESVYETDSVTFITGPDGLEIQTDNISYFAAATPTPEPLPRFELPVREPGFPFGEDFPFGDESVTVRPAAREPSDPGDTGTAPAPRAEPDNSDGGDNTMDFAS